VLHDDEVQLYAFDALALDGEDLRKRPLLLRKMNLARLLARSGTRTSALAFVCHDSFGVTKGYAIRTPDGAGPSGKSAFPREETPAKTQRRSAKGPGQIPSRVPGRLPGRNLFGLGARI
jgi:hypothetical protein